MSDFFTKTRCDRCGEELGVRTTSWFTEDTIGQKCMEEEDRIKAKLRELGKNTNDFEGCGYIPVTY